jgi:predicted anti-sigma-YlaC factor YlaD
VKLERELACREVVELVTAYLEDTLRAVDRERFEEHLVFCDGCDAYLKQMRTTIRLAGSADVALPPELEDRLLEAFRELRAR